MIRGATCSTCGVTGLLLITHSAWVDQPTATDRSSIFSMLAMAGASATGATRLGCKAEGLFHPGAMVIWADPAEAPLNCLPPAAYSAGIA